MPEKIEEPLKISTTEENLEKRIKKYSQEIIAAAVEDIKYTMVWEGAKFFFLEGTYRAKGLANSMFNRVRNKVLSECCSYRSIITLEKPCEINDYSELSYYEFKEKSYHKENEYYERFAYIRTVLLNDDINRVIKLSARCRMFSWHKKDPSDQTADFYWRPDFAEIDLEDKELEKEINPALGSIRFKFGGEPQEVKIIKTEVRPGHRISPRITF